MSWDETRGSGGVWRNRTRGFNDKLSTIKEFNGFSDAIEDVGLSVGEAACEGTVPPTLTVLGMGQDTGGEVYTMGNINGVPFGTDGVVLRLAPTSNK